MPNLYIEDFLATVLSGATSASTKAIYKKKFLDPTDSGWTHH